MTKTTNLSGEICCLCVSLTAFRIFTSLPLIFTQISGTGAPLSALVSGVLAIVFILLFYKGQNVLSPAKSPFARYAVSVSALIYLFASALFTLAEFSRFAKIISFPTTPLWFISLLFIIAAAVGAYKGTSPLLRICRYFIPVFLSLIFLIILSVLWKADPSNLFPLLGNGAAQTFGKGLVGILLYSDIPLIFLIDRPKDRNDNLRRSALLGCTIGVLVCFFTVLAYTIKIPYPLSKNEQFPFYLLMKEVYYGRFFQRVDAIVQLISALWGMFSLCLHLSLITKIFSKTFKVSSRPAVIIPTSVILFFLSISGTVNILPILVFSAALLAVIILFRKGVRQNEN